MTKKPLSLKVGDSVVVKPGVTDPDMGDPIGGWQGRILAIEKRKGQPDMVHIQWDSITLKQMPALMIEHCEEEGLNWGEIWLDTEDVEPAKPRDTGKDVVKAAAEIEEQYAWAFLGRQGRSIQKVLARDFFW